MGGNIDRDTFVLLWPKSINCQGSDGGCYFTI